MAEYVTVSMCDDCRLVFPNGAMRVDETSNRHLEIRGVVATADCPECGKGITTLVDTGYWAKVS